MNPEFSIVVPVYKSVESLPVLFEGITSVMESRGYSFEVIFVEDHGMEESWQELLKIKQANPDTVKIIRLTRNFGQNGATLCGIDQSIGNQVITIDDDLQTPPEEIVRLIDAQKNNGADVIYGIYPETKTSWVRRVGGKIVKYLFNRSEGGSIGSSFRLIQRHIVEKIQFHSQDHLFINQVISWYTIDTQYVDVEHHPRMDGKSGYSLGKLILLSLRLIIYYSSIPLKIMIFFCLCTAIGLLVMLGYYMFYRIAEGEYIDKFMVAVLISMSIISGSISVFGMYINRIYSSRVKKPNYSIKVKL